MQFWLYSPGSPPACLLRVGTEEEKTRHGCALFVIPAFGGREVQGYSHEPETLSQKPQPKWRHSYVAVHLCGSFKCTLHNGDRAQGQCVHWAYMRSQGLIPSCPVLATDKYSHAQVTEGGACLGLRFEGDGFTLPKMPDSKQQEQETEITTGNRTGSSVGLWTFKAHP